MCYFNFFYFFQIVTNEPRKRTRRKTGDATEFLKERAQQSEEIREKKLELEEGRLEQQHKVQQQQADMLKLMHQQKLQNQQQQQQFQQQQQRFQHQQMLMMQQLMGVISKMVNIDQQEDIKFLFLDVYMFKIYIFTKCWTQSVICHAFV